MHPAAPVVVIGAGPAGLTAAYILAKNGVEVTVLEADPQYVGGISRTAKYKDFLFDIGGHRFFSKSREVEAFWDEILPSDMLTRSRSSRIFYRGRFFSYPLRPFEALLKLGPIESIRCVLSYGYARFVPIKDPKNFQEWVSNQFGKRLFEIFFRTYTEKVWGMRCEEISADWAAQRIKGLSLASAVLSAVFPKGNGRGDRGKVVKTLIHTFRYPRKGPGMMWEACADRIHKLGGVVRLGRRVVECDYDAHGGLWRVTHQNADGVSETIKAVHVVSSTPIRLLAPMLKPKLSDDTLKAASALKYRDFLTVVLICRHTGIFSDTWIYIHEPGVKVGRVQNFKAWSPEMVPDPSLSCYGLEYFCFEGDSLWNSTDDALLRLAQLEMETLGLCKPGEVVDGCVVRQPKAYPVYDDDYSRHVTTVREELDDRFPSLHLVGRNGMHKYNNQDHSMMTAMLSAKNILAGRNVFNVWAVNEDAEYHESATDAPNGSRMVPTRVPSAS